MKKHKIQVVYPIDAGGECRTREYYSESEDWKSKPSALGNALATLIARGVAVSLCKPYLKKRKAAKKREEPMTPLPPARFEREEHTFHYTGGNTMDELDQKIVSSFPGKIVRKDLTALLKRGANVPTFVLEYLLGMYCATDDEEAIAAGVKKIRRVLAENYVRPEESEKIKALIRERGEYTIIDKVYATLNEYEDIYVARFSNLEIKPFVIQSEYVVKYTKILMGGIWCVARVSYTYQDDDLDEDDELDDSPRSRKRRSRKRGPEDSPFRIESLRPIQLPNLDVQEIIDRRADFTAQEWMDMLLRSEGMEPGALSEKEKLHFIERMVPLIERNYNLCELGPRGTGKSHLYKEISPYSILMSGGQTTTANLFYSLLQRRVGLVGHWDCVAFDEVAGMHFRDQDAIQIMKDYMASGSFARGRDVINADASMVFVGNINDSVQNLLKVTHLFSPFPPEFNNDSAFFDRMHYYLPGWEIPKMRSELLTGRYGLITDCLAEFTHAMRSRDYSHLLDQYFTLNGQFNKRDEIAVRKTMSGLLKLLFPDENVTKEEMARLLDYAIEGRRRVKEQLKIMAGVEFSDVNLGYLDVTGAENVISVPEQSAETLVPAGTLPAGHVYAVGECQDDDDVAVFRLENKAVRGAGRFETQGIGLNRPLRESMNAAWQYFQNNAKRVMPGVLLADRDYLLYYDSVQGKGPSLEVSLAEWVGLCSALLDKPVVDSLAIVGEIRLSGSMGEVRNLESIVRVAKNAGARRLLLPAECMQDLMRVSGELLSAVQPIFYMNPVDAARKAMDIY